MVKTLPSNTGDVSSIPGWGTKISRASRPENQNIKQKQSCNKINKVSKKKKALFFSVLRLQNSRWQMSLKPDPSNAQTTACMKPDQMLG